jgi:hypothetical protein
VPCHVAISSHPFQLKTPLLGLKNSTFLTQNNHFSYQKALKSVFLAIFDRFPQNQIFLQKKKKKIPCHATPFSSSKHHNSPSKIALFYVKITDFPIKIPNFGTF